MAQRPETPRQTLITNALGGLVKPNNNTMSTTLNQETKGFTQDEATTTPYYLGVDPATPRAELERISRPEEPNKIWPIKIEELNRGYLVHIGCHSFAFSTKEELTVKIVEYINNPAETEKKWFEGKLF